MHDGRAVYAFSDFYLDLGCRELRHGDEVVKLRGKVFDMLALLITHRDRVVCKDELVEHVWMGRNISETTVSSSVKELRRALGDSGKTQRLIKTVHGKGFRFVAPLSVEDASPVVPTPSPDPVPPSPVERDVAAAATLDAPVAEIPADANTASSTAERKTFSVLCCGLVASAEWAQRMGVDAAHDLMEALFASAQTVVSRYDGQVTQWRSDGFLALFGAPVARDDHARLALLSAFEVRERARSLGDREASIQLRFGINSGTAIVGTVPGQPDRLHTGANPVVQFAEALQAEAEPDQILAGSGTKALLGAEAQTDSIGGREDAVCVERLHAPRAGVPRRFLRPLAPLIGREREMGLLNERFAQALAGHGHAVAIVGNAGIGKTRLVDEFCGALTEHRIRHIQVNCFAHVRNVPHYGLASLLRQRCDLVVGEDDDKAIVKLDAVLAEAELADSDTSALMRRLLELPHDANVLERLSANAQRDMLMRGVRHIFLRTADATAMVLEDIHWLDPSSRTWLTGLIQQTSSHPLLVVVTSRPGDDFEWLQLPWVSQLGLSPLNAVQRIELLRALPQANVLSEQLDELATRSGGNPLFLEELAAGANGAGDAVPDTVQGVLGARIDKLQVLDKQLLQMAAVIGHRGPLTLLEHVSGYDAQQMDAAMLRLQCAELLFRTFSDIGEHFEFRNALVHEVTYASQLAVQRRRMHECVATTLHEHFAPLLERRPGFLAHHHGEAGHAPESARFWHRAARLACDRSAYAEAIDCVRKGQAQLPSIEDAKARAESELALLRTLGAALMATRGYGAADVEQTYTRARELCEVLGDDSALFRVLIGLTNYYAVSNDFANAFACNRRLLRLSRRAGQDGLSIRAKASMGELMLQHGRLPSARRYLEQTLALSESSSRPVLSTQVTTVATTGYIAWLSWLQGDEREALRAADAALALARELERPFTLAIALCLAAELHRFRGDPASVLPLAQESAGIAEQQGFPYWHGYALITWGWAQSHTGDAKVGLATLHRGLALTDATGATAQRVAWLGALADAYRVACKQSEAFATFADAKQWAERAGGSYYGPQLSQLEKRLSEECAGGQTAGAGDRAARVIP